jgi:allophanate hydrolase
MSWDPITGSLDFAALHHHFATGLSLPALMKAVQTRCERHPDPAVWISLRPWEEIFARAETLEKFRKASSSGGLDPELLARYPLFGLPFAVKDNIDVAGLQTTAACPAFAYQPPGNASVVERLEAAGAIVIGKTNMDQFATGLVGTRSPYGAASNVFNPAYVSGGSSSGSAVAVAAGLVSFSLGTDTAGSGRVPAAFNNIVGLKPSRGLLSARGVVPACRSLDCLSVFAGNVADAFRAFRVAQAPDPSDPFSRSVPAESRLDALSPLPKWKGPGALGPFRFGMVETSTLPPGPYRDLFDAARARLEKLGGTAVIIPMDLFEETARLLYHGPWVEERKAAFGGFIESHPDAALPVIKKVLAAAGPFTAAQAYQAYYRLRDLRGQAAALFQDLECVVMPTAPEHPTKAEVEADPVGVNVRLGKYTNFVNLLDLTALAVPAGFAGELPFGITLIAPAFREARLASLGARFHADQGLPQGAGKHRVPEPALAPLDPPAPRLAVAGLHLSGQPLNPQLTSLGARLLRVTRTAPVYTLHVVTRGDRTFPGIVRACDGREGGAVEVEIWEMTAGALGAFMENVKEPLGIGTLELEDGEKVKGFLCEAYAALGARDITGLGGWRAWLDAQRDAG